MGELGYTKVTNILAALGLELSLREAPRRAYARRPDGEEGKERMIRVWTDASEAGLLDRRGARGSAFLYQPGASPGPRCFGDHACALCLLGSALRTAPIFEMNLPEGVMRERLRLAFAKATGSFDEFDLLEHRRPLAGRPHSLFRREAAAQPRTSLFSRSMRFWRRAAVAIFIVIFSRNSQPSPASAACSPRCWCAMRRRRSRSASRSHGISESYRGATHIVKFWDQNEFPQLAANEYFCLQAAERCGLEVPRYRLAEDALSAGHRSFRPPPGWHLSRVRGFLRAQCSPHRGEISRQLRNLGHEALHPVCEFTARSARIWSGFSP